MTENFKKFFSEFAAMVEQEKATMKSKYSVNDIDELMGSIEYFLDTDPSNWDAISKINCKLEYMSDHCQWGYYDGLSWFYVMEDEKEMEIMAKELSAFVTKMRIKVNEYMSFAIDRY